LATIPVEAPWKLPGHRFYYPNWLKDTIFDCGTSVLVFRNVDTGVGWFHFWNGHGLWSARKARRQGLATVVERNSLYPSKQEALLKAEFKKFGLNYRPTHPISLKRNLAELKEADFIATPSKLVYQSIIGAGIPERRVWKPNPLGVDYNKFKIENGKLKINKGLNFIFVGGDPVRKGLFYLLKAWSKIEKNSQLFILGLPPRTFDQHPFKQFKGLAGVKHIGWADSVQYYKKSHVLVAPSVEDGWNLTVLEAMAAGLAVIVSENTGAKDAVKDKETGFIVPACDYKALAEKIEFFMKNPSKAGAMGKEGREAVRRYSWERYGKQLLGNYRVRVRD
jgi:glycosyltransferase involved in cell wall biosynthesis